MLVACSFSSICNDGLDLSGRLRSIGEGECIMAKVGQKAQGADIHAKVYVARHGHAPPRSAQAAEKAIETKVRQAGKKICRDWYNQG